MRSAPYIRLLLTIAILFAVAPLCAGAAVCAPCDELSCFADEHGVVAEVVKRPVGTTPPVMVSALKPPAASVCGPTALRTIRREAPPAPAARLRV